jgi:hypothetical protein
VDSNRQQNFVLQHISKGNRDVTESFNRWLWSRNRLESDPYRTEEAFCFKYIWLGYGLDAGVRFRQEQGFLLLATASRPALGPTEPPIQGVPGVISPVVKGSEREADPTLSSSAEVKNAWSYTSTLPYVFMAWCLVKEWMRVHGMVLRHRTHLP